MQQTIRDAKTRGYVAPVGGHQHEGMCSGPNVLIIDVSRIDGCNVEGETACSSGRSRGARRCRRASFSRAADARTSAWRLVQGGGWGLRPLGLTCDRLSWFRIVTADGKILEVSDSPKTCTAICSGPFAAAAAETSESS